MALVTDSNIVYTPIVTVDRKNNNNSEVLSGAIIHWPDPLVFFYFSSHQKLKLGYKT